MSSDSKMIIATVLIAAGGLFWSDDATRDRLDSVEGKVDGLSEAVGNLQQRMALVDGRITSDAVIARRFTELKVSDFTKVLERMVLDGSLTQEKADSLLKSIDPASPGLEPQN